MTSEDLKLKSDGLKRIIEISIENFINETGFPPIVEMRITEIPGYGDQATKRFTQVVVKIEV